MKSAQSVATRRMNNAFSGLRRRDFGGTARPERTPTVLLVGIGLADLVAVEGVLACCLVHLADKLLSRLFRRELPRSPHAQESVRQDGAQGEQPEANDDLRHYHPTQR